MVERIDIDAALARVGRGFDIIPTECDGIVALVDGDPAEFIAVLNSNLGDASQFADKPYRCMADIKAHLRTLHPDIPANYFDDKDDDWEASTERLMNVRKRLFSGECPL